MKLTIIITIIVFIVFMLFYGIYYIFNPSLRGEDILTEQSIPYPAVIAHRGASILAPESTRPAFVKARKDGADYLEADLHQTKDGEIVVFHDNILKRKSNIKEVFPERAGEEIGEFTLEELRELDIGSWFNRKYPQKAREEYENLKILTLEELIDIAKEGKHDPGLVLELKSPDKYSGIENKIVKILEQKQWLPPDEDNTDIDSNLVSVGKGTSRVIFFSFNLDSLEKLKKLVPEYPCLLLITDNMITRRNWNKWLNRAEEVIDGLGPKGFMCWPWHIASAHDQELFVFPYVINHAWQIKILSQFKSDGFITDRPEIVLNFLDRFAELPEITELLEEPNEN